MTRASPLSDFDVLRLVRLPNWGRAGRCDPGKPDPEAICAGIYDMGKFKDPGDSFDAAPEPPPPPIDHRDAESLDAYILQMPGTHKESLRHAYYVRGEGRKDVRTDDLYAAIRALMDTMDANRRVVKRMRELGR